jgi:amino acid adenylation domain-containing protein
MNESLKRITNLSPEQRDLLLRRLARIDSKSPDRAPKLERRRLADQPAVPLSFAQERAWFRDCLAPGDRARNITGALRLEGRLSIDALSAMFAEILRMHEVLRASFSPQAGEPVQTIIPPVALPIEFIDFSNLEPVQREAASQRRYSEETRRGFDLSNDRLLRATLIRLGPEEHLLLLTMHHIASDGWSIGVLMNEMSALYTAFTQSIEPELPDLPIQYSDFAVWQRERLQTGAFNEGLSYWRRQLDNSPPILELRPDLKPGASTASTEGGVNGATCFLQLGRELKQQLDELSRQEDTTLFTTLLTSFMVLLMRCTGQQDILIGSPVSGRTRIEMERLVGLFVNTIALRAKLSPELTFREALGIVRKTVLEGLAHHEVPFERVVQDLDPERRSTSHPLFDIVFNFTPSPPRQIDLPGLRVRFEEPPETDAEFSMQLYVTEWDGTLELRLVYQSNRYSEARMSCLLDQLQAILRQVIADADRRVGSLDLASPLSRSLLPNPAITLDEPMHKPVPQIIAEWVARTPDQPALCQQDITLTYADLGVRMTSVADHLRAAGFTPGDFVAVFGPRSPGIVICMAGVLLAGGVLLTLSTDIPEQRHRLMLQEAGARFLLRVGDSREEDNWINNIQGITTINVDALGTVSDSKTRSNILSSEDSALLSRTPDYYLSESGEFPRERSGTLHPAYIFFTSGSTGKPKGVLGTHTGLAHFLDWQRKTFDVGPGDRCGQLTGLSFDVVLRDIFLPLTSGATLILPANEDTATGEHTLRWLERESISLIHTVPAVADMWLTKVPSHVSLAKLRRIFFAGEPLTSALIERWRKAFPLSGNIVNLYGPTETTLAKCYYQVPSEPVDGIQPLGRPLPQTQAFVLTQDRELCGIGEPGEIALRTPFRSLGYINIPEENARRFVVNPFTGIPDDKLYLTGDRGIYRADGLLEFLGRLDDQVKIRGVRVEPVEIANILRACPDIASCAVMARDDGPEGLILVAYVVLAEGVEQNAGRLQEFLRQRLPAPMVPAAFVFLDSLPLTSNQKLDRRRLPAPDHTRPKLEGDYLAPRNTTELQLVHIWEELLNVKPIGVRDKFFDIGGHSLLAMRLLMHVEQRIGKQIPLIKFFECPTVEHLAAVSRQEEDEWARVVKLWPTEHRLKLFFVHTGGGIIHNYIHLVRHLGAQVPVYGLQAKGLDGKSDPHNDLEQMAADYVEHVRRMQPEGPYLLGGHSFGGVVAFEMSRQLHDMGQQVALLALFDSAIPSLKGIEYPVEEKRNEDAHTLAGMITAIEGFMGRRIDVSYEDLHQLSTDDQIEYIVEALKRIDAPMFGGGPEVFRVLLKVNRAHLQAKRNYRARVSPVPITLFRAQDAHTDSDESLGWSAVSEYPVQVLWTPGDHVSMMAEPNVESLARIFQPCLTEVIQP